jgi:DNA-binding transcriptional ArsR family regulator
MLLISRSKELSVPVPSPLPDPLVELIAERFRVIGEPLRIKLLDRLRAGEASVSELTDALGATQQNVSRHLAVLHAAGIVSRRKEGTRVLYGIADQTVFALCESVCGSLQQAVAELSELLGTAAPAAGSRS